MTLDMHTYYGHDDIGTIGNDATYGTADMAGVMMIAIQALTDKNNELKEEVAQLK